MLFYNLPQSNFSAGYVKSLAKTGIAAPPNLIGFAPSLAATRKRHAHLLAQKQLEEQSADETHQAETERKVTA